MSTLAIPHQIEVHLWNPVYRDAFIRLNREWIETYFCLEASDLKILGNPEEVIIRPGGQIFIAVEDGLPVGCCALVHHPDTGNYELAKMAVSPAAQGHGIGTRLGEALINYARKKGVPRLFLEANTKLEASVKLYYKLGFQAIEADHPAYARCNLYMEKWL
jgi:GNAT superfamily N-acetyltransferase